jgi:hypothetical protein
MVVWVCCLGSEGEHSRNKKVGCTSLCQPSSFSAKMTACCPHHLLRNFWKKSINKPCSDSVCRKHTQFLWTQNRIISLAVTVAVAFPMGCGASKDDIAKYNFLVAERDQLALEKADLLRKIELLQCNLEKVETQFNEQLNLYRFKIEVLVQMLAIEEKKQQAIVKRLEILKLALLNQGVSNTTMTSILAQAADSTSSRDEKSILLTSAFDLSGAMGRMAEEMISGADDIIFSFADAEGKIVSALPREDFMRYLYNATDSLTKADVQILSLRFYDGQTVCVPEFIDFFTMSTNSRVARSAAAAVRASLHMLQLQNEPLEDNLGPVRATGRIQVGSPFVIVLIMSS